MTLESELAKSWEEDVRQRYARHFVELLRGRIEFGDRPLRALDISAGVGVATLELFAALPRGSQIVAISDDRFALRELHAKLDDDLREHIFPRKEDPARLPFAPATFDLVWACMPTRLLNPIRPVIRAALRSLRPGGQLLITVPAAGSFLELTGAIGAYRSSSSGPTAIQQLLSARVELLDGKGWEETLSRNGAIEVSSQTATAEVVVTPPLSRDRLFAEHLLPMWLGQEPGDLSTENMLDNALIDSARVKIHMVCVSGRRGMDELDDNTE